MTDRLIFYGCSLELFQEIEAVHSQLNLKDCTLEHGNNPPLLLLDNSFGDFERNILIFEENYLTAKLTRQLLCWRRSAVSLSLFVFVIMPNADEEFELQKKHFFRSGVNLIGSNDGDVNLTFLQMLYLVYDGCTSLPIYAETKNTFAQAKLHSLAFVERINSSSCILSTDLELSALDEYAINLDDMEISLKRGKMIASPSLESYAQKEYFWEVANSSSWGVGNQTEWDTIETQLKMAGNKLSSEERKKILIIEDTKNFIKLMGKSSCLAFDIDFFHCEPETGRCLELLEGEWDVILIGSTLSWDDDDRMDFILRTSDLCNQKDRAPLLFITNMTSKTEALRKLLRYDKLLVSPEPFSNELFSLLLPALEKHRPAGIESYITETPNCLCAFYIDVDCVITSLSESFITFVTHEQLLVKSILKLDIGIELTITIVPPFRDLKKVGGKTHYMGFISGLSEEELELLRRIVNHYLKRELRVIDNSLVKPIADEVEANPISISPEASKLKEVKKVERTEILKEDSRKKHTKF